MAAILVSINRIYSVDEPEDMMLNNRRPSQKDKHHRRPAQEDSLHWLDWPTEIVNGCANRGAERFRCNLKTSDERLHEVPNPQSDHVEEVGAVRL